MDTAKSPEKESTFTTLIYPVLVLVGICLVCSALLALLNNVTAPVIEANEKAATLASYLEVLPEGTDAATLTDYTDLTTDGVEGAVGTPDGIVAVKAAAAGYSGEMVTLYIAFDADGGITDMRVDASTQTPGIGSNVANESFYGGFVGWDNDDGSVSDGTPVDTYGGATYSSSAVFTAVNAAIHCYNNELS